MPSLGADMDEGTLVEWLVKPGDAVHRGDVIAVIDTAKTAMDVEVFEDGVVERLLVEPGTKLPVAAPMAVIRSNGEQPPRETPPVAAPAPAAAVESPHVESPLVRRLARERGIDLAAVHGTGAAGLVTRADLKPAAPPAPPALPEQPEQRPAPAWSGPVVRAVPRARRRAAELGVGLDTVTGTGPGGVITPSDVELAAHPTAVPHAPASTDRAAAMQAAVGVLMARGKREIPHFYLGTTIDLAAATRWLADTNAHRSPNDRLVMAALLLKATAVAAARAPDVNGFWVDGAYQRSAAVHLGVAISLRGGGLVAPAIHDTDQLALDTLMQRLRDLVARARAGRLRQSEMSDPTLTVTNLGELGVPEVYGVIYPPQVALVGFGRVVEMPCAVEGMLAVHPVVRATLSGDHRVSDGHRGSRFLTTVDDLLQRPEEL